jgi:integrase
MCRKSRLHCPNRSAKEGTSRARTKGRGQRWAAFLPRPSLPGDRQQIARSDLVTLRVDDVAPHGYAIDRANVRQKKTARPVRFELTEQTRESLDAYLRSSGRDPDLPPHGNLRVVQLLLGRTQIERIPYAT